MLTTSAQCSVPVSVIFYYDVESRIQCCATDVRVQTVRGFSIQLTTPGFMSVKVNTFESDKVIHQCAHNCRYISSEEAN